MTTFTKKKTQRTKVTYECTGFNFIIPPNIRLSKIHSYQLELCNKEKSTLS